MSKKIASSAVTFNPLFWATETTTPGSLEENKTVVPGATVKTAGTATIYASNNASISTTSFGVSSEGCVITSVSTNVEGLSATLNGERITITASAGIKKKTEGNVIVHTDKGTATATKVTIEGANEPVLYNKESVYKDSSKKNLMTVENYASQGYAKTGMAYYGWKTIEGHTYYFDKNGNKVTGPQVINHSPYTFGSDGKLLTSGIGIDVSKYQKNINWSQAKTAISFAIIRCGYRGRNSRGLAVDPYYAQNMKNAKANGVRVGVYYYSTATNEAEAVEEASAAIERVREQGGVSLPIYIDMEDKIMAGLSKPQRTAIVHAFCRTVASAGYRPGVYANKNWFDNYLNTSEFGSYSVWVARYLNNPNATSPGVKFHYDIWQFTSKGSIPGINGNVDMNRSYF
jgi:GH25 family lysozyme M1 (1,4-beta-N-acetylmuramidase)